MENNNDNLKLWSKLDSMPSDQARNFNNGSFSGTNINTTWRLMRLTEAFGVCGFGWTWTCKRRWTETVGTDILCFVEGYLRVKINGEWSEPIEGSGGNMMAQLSAKSGQLRASDECYKKAESDAIGTACVKLGMAARIYMGDSDPFSKYAPFFTDKKQQEADEQAALDFVAAIYGCKSREELNATWSSHPEYQKDKNALAAAQEMGKRYPKSNANTKAA